MQRKDSQGDGAGGGENLRGDHDAAAIEAVGDMAGGESQENDGGGADEADPGEGEGVFGSLV